MNTVLSMIILIRQNTFKQDNTYIIADYILKHIDEIEGKSIQEIANECYVSTNTILRFCHTLGFQTFKMFKNTLVSTIKTRIIQLTEKNKDLQTDDILKHIQNLVNVEFDIEKFQNQLDLIMEYILKYHHIHLYGAVFPLSLAQSFIEDMALLGIDIDVHQSCYRSHDLKQDDGLHMVISFSGRFVEANRNEYNQILSMNYPKVLISHMNLNIGHVDVFLQLPQTISSHYDDLLLLLIYDYILLVLYHQKYGE